MRARRILVLGAGGFIGGQLVAELASRGHHVTCAGRTPARLSRRFPACAATQADLTRDDVNAWAPRLAGIGAVGSTHPGRRRRAGSSTCSTSARKTWVVVALATVMTATSPSAASAPAAAQVDLLGQASSDVELSLRGSYYDGTVGRRDRTRRRGGPTGVSAPASTRRES